MRKLRHFLLFLGLAALVPALSAGTEPQLSAGTPVEKVPLDIFTADTTYVFESDLNHGGSFGKQDELENQFEYAHRFLLKDQWYLHLGLAYTRFDFGNTRAPVPDHLQSGAAVIGIDYMQGADTGAFLQFRPGFYTEDNIGLASFDCPILAGRFWTLQPDKLYILTGVYTAFLKGGYPVLPLAGVIWHPNDSIRVMGILPNPRVIYTVNKQLEVYVGGELAGGSFRTDHHDNYVGPHIAKLSGTQVDYVDYRAGGGFTYSLTNAISIDGNAGCAIQRAFHYHRAGENYRTDPAPYLQVALKASF
ncbi:MAG TPA: hypothetical protein VGG94_03775 [Chthoniobacterales bacterium]|jgi:hypothetical protein